MTQENSRDSGRNGISIQLVLVLVLVLAVLLVIFTLQNQEKVSLKLFFWTIREIPVVLLIIVCLLLGYLIPYFSLISRIWKLKSELRQTKLEKEELEESVMVETDVTKRPDPEGIPFDDDDYSSRSGSNISGRFFRE